MLGPTRLLMLISGLAIVTAACGGAVPTATPTTIIAVPPASPTPVPTVVSIQLTPTPMSVPPTARPDLPSPTPTQPPTPVAASPTPPAIPTPTASPAPTQAAATPTSAPPTSVPTPTQPLGKPGSVTIVASLDNTLYQSNIGGNSNGAGESLFTGVTNGGETRRAVLAFDLTGKVPKGARITKATLTLDMTKTTSGPEKAELHKLLADWGEGSSDANAQEGQGTSAAPNDATWIHRFFDKEKWAKEGGDFAVSTSAQTTVGNNARYTWGPTPEMTADVQSWVDDPSKNFGWILLGNERSSPTTKRFSSRQNANESGRPMLTVEFTAP
ncbi:MAG: DNRLRE domain-containing protein [Chloroflexi bacterium]|nr:DNRLRE domain-containing protein [Chloroflexota bacterium]